MKTKLPYLVLSMALAACAMQSKPAESPSAPASTTAPAASAPPAGAPMSEPGATSTPPATPPPPPPPTGAAAAAPTPKPEAPATGAGAKPGTIGAAQASFDDARKAFVAAADCPHMCKALSSMENATTHLCELSQGAEQKRCADAKAKLAAADAKVKSTCGGCGP